MPKKLLLADDSVTIQRVIELTFADEDIDVIAVGDGKQAIARIESDRPDVVLADVGMPERDGYEVAAHIKGNPQFAHIPVLLLTGAFEPIDEARARSVGCDGVLVKPFEPQMVINRVKDLLAGRRPPNVWAGPPGPTGATAAPARPAVAPPPTETPRAVAEPAPSRTVAEPAQPEEKKLESLDDYFDRLDAAFSSETAAPPEPAPTAQSAPPARTTAPQAPAPVAPAAEKPESAVDFGGWDIPLESKAATQPSAPMSVAPPPSPPFSAPQLPSESMSPPASASSPGHGSIPSGAPSGSAAPALADAFAALLAAEQQLGSAPAAPQMAAAAPAISEDAIEQIVRRVLARMTEETVRATVLDVAERLVKEEIERIKKQ